MRIGLRVAAVCLGVGVITVGIATAASHGHFVVLDSQGVIADQQRRLLYWVLGLMALVVIPVFVLLGHIAFRYRAGNDKATYAPEWDHSHKLESIWWGFPTLIIAILSIIIWNTSHSLDPFRPIASDRPPLTIQVVALQWKWLFIYPAEEIATVNYVKLPVNRPVNFEITADSPMNSFWIPQLGGQVYAMSGMRTNLHLMANTIGNFEGSSANLSGAGFADMRFQASAVTDADFNAWVSDAQQTSTVLDYSTYGQLAQPSRQSATVTYQLDDRYLQDIIISKYDTHHHGKGSNNPATPTQAELQQLFKQLDEPTIPIDVSQEME